MEAIMRNMLIKFFVFIFLSCWFVQANAIQAQEKSKDDKSVTTTEEKAKPAETSTKNSLFSTPFTIKFDNGVSFTLYGKFDMVAYYDTTSVFVSDWYAYVLPKGTYEGEQHSFNISARGSLFGLKFNFPKALGSGDINAKFEMDFVGGFVSGSMSTYSPLMRLKHAYISWDSEHYSVLLGQTFCPISPLFPDTGTWVAMATSGNPWMRLPQIMFTTRFKPVEFVISIARPMASTVTVTDSSNDRIGEGEQSGVPFTIGRFGFTSAHFTTGASGIFGREQIHRVDSVAGINVNKSLNLWMAGYDMKFTSEYFDILGEFFLGTNLSSFFAGVLQGVNTTATDAKGIRTYGGWGQFSIKPTKKFYLNAGAGIDDPKDSDLTTAQRSFNLTVFGNLNYRLMENWTISVEPAYMRTGYIGANANSNMRGMFRTAFAF
jgi:hypothetical protein